MVKSVPKHYEDGVGNFGFLILKGNEVFVPLDGQHRLTAIKFAISGKDEAGRDIPGVDASMDVGSDICTCIMIRHDADKARKIFNKVNRYAKATSKSDNLITADDDIIAVVTRDIVHERLHDRLVNYKTNTLTKNSPEFTTLSTLYEATAAVIESAVGLNKKIDRTILPPEAEQKLINKIAGDFWQAFFTSITALNAPLMDPTESGDEKRRQFRDDYVIGKPIIQLALVEAIVRLAEPDEVGARLSMEEIYNRVNKCDWQTDNDTWQRVLMNGDKVITGQQARKFASRFLSYYLGEKLTGVELKTLGQQYSDLFDSPGKSLPPPVA